MNLKYLLIYIFIFSTSLTFTQNVVLKGKTKSYYSKKKIKDVEIKIYVADSLISTHQSKGNFKIIINSTGLFKVFFVKEGYIDKYFLLNTNEIPKYDLEKKFTINADVSIIHKDKYMESNTIKNAVAYVYFNKKYRHFIWDAEFTKKAQIEMDATVFPLEEVMRLDSNFNPKNTPIFFKNGINIMINMEVKAQQLFEEKINLNSKSKLKQPVINGYLYGKFTYFLIFNKLDSINKIVNLISPNHSGYNSISEGLKDCKNIDVEILKNKNSAIGYWIHLMNISDTTHIQKFTRNALKLENVAKYFISLDMTDAELSFYADIKYTLKKAIQLDQVVSSLNELEIKDAKNYQNVLNAFKKQVRLLSRNNELTTDF